MHECEFCRTEFLSRPQVKKPRACEKCQNHRQRANEREWHERHKHFDDRYHRIRREQRLRAIEKLVHKLIECLTVGLRLSGVVMELKIFSEILENVLVDLGVRRINKFWAFQNGSCFKGLGGSA